MCGIDLFHAEISVGTFAEIQEIGNSPAAHGGRILPMGWIY